MATAVEMQRLHTHSTGSFDILPQFVADVKHLFRRQGEIEYRVVPRRRAKGA